MKKLWLLIVLLPFLIGCNKNSSDVEGIWKGTDSFNIVQTFSFDGKGSGTWEINGDDISAFLKIKYKIDDSEEPYKITIFGIQEGFLKNKKLYGIYIIEDGKFLKLDASVGVAEEARPKEFSSETVYYRKVEN